MTSFVEADRFVQVEEQTHARQAACEHILKSLLQFGLPISKGDCNSISLTISRDFSCGVPHKKWARIDWNGRSYGRPVAEAGDWLKTIAELLEYVENAHPR